MYQRTFYVPKTVSILVLFTPTLLSCEKLRVEMIERESNNAEVTTRHTLKSPKI